ncbi:MAG: glycosyltransferase family 9 protein [Ignavibacteriae bacterium]|nr:glycosyltransferase family 9 protein [Ignavibacteriota bacterium]
MNIIIDRDKAKKILIIKFGGLGDVFLSTIVIDSLKNYFPNSTLDYLVEKAGREAIAHDPRIQSVFTLDKETMNPISIIASVRKQQYDMVIDLFGNPRSAIITFLSGATFRVGLDYGWRKHLYSIVGQAQRDKLHGAAVNLQALTAMGIPVVNRRLQFPLSSNDQHFASEFWKSNQLDRKFVVGILPTGGWPSKRCEPSKFAEIGAALVTRYDAKVLIVWGPSDKNDALEIHRLMNSSAVVGPPASLAQNIALLSRCTAIISNDSGPMHIASSFDVPILCIYGPTFPEGPYGEIHSWVRNEGLSCLACNLLQCPIQHQCMAELPVQIVLDTFEQMLQNNNIRIIA